MILKKKGFSLAEMILVSVFSASLLYLTYVVFSSMATTSKKAEANDAAVFQASSLISEHMSSSMRFTSSALIKIFNNYKSDNNSNETVIVGFPLRGYKRMAGVQGFRSVGELGYYVQNPGVKKENISEWIDPEGTLEWTSYVIYYYHYDKDEALKLNENDKNVKELVSGVDSVNSGIFQHRGLYEIKFFIKNSNDTNFTDEVSGSEYVFFIQPKTTELTNAGATEMGLPEDADLSKTIVTKTDDFNNLIDIIEKAYSSKSNSIISVRKLASNVEHFYVKRDEYPLINVRVDLDYGKGGSTFSKGMKADLIEKEIHTLSFSILPAVR